MKNEHLVYQKSLPRGNFRVYSTKPTLELLKIKQTHSNIAHREAELKNHTFEESVGDAIVGNSTMPLAILTADCLPIVLIGASAHAVVHAGWRGLQNEVLKNPLIAEINPYYAFIGPHICSRCYEVQADFRHNFDSPECFRIKGEKTFFDLSEFARKQLKLYYPSIEIEVAELCTFETEGMHSFRKNKTTERNWNIYFP